MEIKTFYKSVCKNCGSTRRYETTETNFSNKEFCWCKEEEVDVEKQVEKWIPLEELKEQLIETEIQFNKIVSFKEGKRLLKAIFEELEEKLKGE